MCLLQFNITLIFTGFIKKLLCCFFLTVELLLILLVLIYFFGRICSVGFPFEYSYMPPLTDLPKIYSTKLPQVQNIFVGRDTELQTLVDFLDFHNSTVQMIGIFGGPGIGKSTLAIKAAHKIYVSDKNVAIDYFDVSEVLYVPHLLHKILGGMINSTEHSVMIEELKHWAQINFSQHKILIFDGCDNLFNSNQKGMVQQIFDILIKHSTFVKIIFTSKHIVTFIGQFKKIKLEELLLKDAVNLLMMLNSRLLEQDAVKIANGVGNVPLALQVVGALLETDTMSPQAIVTEITTNPIKVLSPDSLPEYYQVQTSLQLSYDSLDNEYTQSCARFLVNFPGSFSHDAAVGVLTYMVNRTYWYVEILHEFKIFLNWVPQPSECLKILVHRSLLKYHSNSHHYSFHKLIKMFLLSVNPQNSETDNEIQQFKKGFVFYFADYWDTYHDYVRDGNYDTNVIAALDLERHNFEYLEKILPELGLDISYIKRYTEAAELYANYSDSLTDYFKHMKKSAHNDIALVAVEDTTSNLKDRYRIVMMLDLHSKAVISEHGAEHYMDIFVEMIIQVSFFENYLHGPKAALDYLKFRKERIMELHKEHGHEVVKYVNKFLDQMKKNCFEVSDIDTFAEVLQLKARLLWPLEKCVEKSCNNYEIGRAYFGSGSYGKALQFYNNYLKDDIQEDEYLYTLVMIYYCHKFNGNEEKVTETVRLLDSELIHNKLTSLVVNDKNCKKVHIIALFYGKVRHGTEYHYTLYIKIFSALQDIGSRNISLLLKYRYIFDYFTPISRSTPALL